MSEEDLRFGSVSISEDAHEFLANLVENEEGFLEDSPFTAIVEAFRFAFALGYSRNLREKKGGKTMTIAPRQFVVMDYYDLLEEEAREEDASLGGLVSEYAEAGAQLMIEYSDNPDFSILSVLSLGEDG